MIVAATEAKNQFGRLLEQAQSQPVVIEKSGRRHSVLISAQRYDELMLAAQRRGRSPKAAVKAFAERYGQWVAEQQRHFDQHGVWDQEYRSW